MTTDDQRAGAALLPCPFCGGSEIFIEDMGTRCKKCGTFGPMRNEKGESCHLKPLLAGTAWNARASDKREGEGAKAWNGEPVEPEDVLSDKEIGAFQDLVRGVLVDAVNGAGGHGDGIDGGGCDSGYWPDLTISEVKQGVGMLEEIIAELKQPKPAGEAGGWVACTDKMPGIDQPVEWRCPGVRDTVRLVTGRPTHWRPTPPPEPKTGDVR